MLQKEQVSFQILILHRKYKWGICSSLLSLQVCPYAQNKRKHLRGIGDFQTSKPFGKLASYSSHASHFLKKISPQHVLKISKVSSRLTDVLHYPRFLPNCYCFFFLVLSELVKTCERGHVVSTCRPQPWLKTRK